ncbi:elongation factor G [Limnoglobus roseus]|uniref:Elongation factor G n=1 Tax=Limnoglobus roseus TaxID=2598579 RepID=A0A5C1AGC1_9BACT|nr:elongation factor G [Limnoglobus roseus]QEL17197.1 elongation factor G [Limnoglobus roseus]
MSKHLVDDVRDIALVGHRAAGKTSLADALLFEAHAVDRLGSVDDGTSAGDTDEDEKRHHFSIDTHVLHAEHGGKHLNILDAPGTPDFIGAMIEALSAVETAAVVVCAVNGIQVNTRRMFHEAGRLGLARIFIINKVDADKIDFEGVVGNIRETFGKNCVLFNMPNNVGPNFNSVIDLVHKPTGTPTTHPYDQKKARIELMEAVVEVDEALMEKYLTAGSISDAELEEAIPKCIAAGYVVPIFCTSAKKDRGVKELLDGLEKFGLSPAMSRKKLEGKLFGTNGSTKNAEPTDTAEFLGQVFKVVNDRYVGHLSFIRVLSGTLTPNHTVIDLNNGKSIRVGQLLQVKGKSHEPIQEAVPGDIIAVAKVEGLHVGDTVAFRADAPKMPEMGFPSPMFGVAVEPKTRGDETKIAAGLHKIAEEDPTLRITHDPQTHELVVSGVSQLHLEVIRERLKHRFDVEVVTKDPKIPYRETIQAKGEGDYKHKKQTGGRGQFAEVHLRVFPLSRDIKTQEQLEKEFANRSNFEKLRTVHYDPAMNFAFLDHIVGGTIPNNFIPAIEKGVREMMDRGALAGYRMQDIAVEVYFGKYHDVDSSEAAFKTAARYAFKKAFMAARPTLLEPIVKLDITTPSKFTGAVLGDLPTKRAHVENQDTLPGDLNMIQARAPLGEVARYAAQLGGMTQGQGSYAMELSHYETVPAAVQQQVVAKSQLKELEDE